MCAGFGSGLFWLIMQTRKIPIDHVNVMETSLQSIGRRTQNLLPDEAVHLFIAGEEECFSICNLCAIL